MSAPVISRDRIPLYVGPGEIIDRNGTRYVVAETSTIWVRKAGE